MGRIIVRLGLFVTLATLLVSVSMIVVEQENTENRENETEQHEATRYYEGQLFELPVVIIDTEGQTIDEDIPIQGEWMLYDQKTTFFMQTEPLIEGEVALKIRGNTTRAFPKKQYKVELQDENGFDYNESVLGMPSESDWVLNGPFKDKSMMRNYLAYELIGTFMPMTPKVRFCEVFITHDAEVPLSEAHYQGIYIMIESVKRDESRVAIGETGQSDETSFIVARNPLREGDTKVNTFGTATYRSDYDMQVVYPKQDELTEGKIEYIEETINTFEWVLYSDVFDDPDEGYAKYIDVASFVDYVVVNEFFNNRDAGVLSTYLYKDYGGKLAVGPVWDFNSAMGNQYSATLGYGESKGFHMQDKVWFDQLMKDEAFVEQVIERYRELRETYLSDEVIFAKIDETVTLLGDAVYRNNTVWPFEMMNQELAFKNNEGILKQVEADRSGIMQYFEEHPELKVTIDGYTQTYEEEIAFLKQFIEERGKWLDEHIDKLLIGSQLDDVEGVE